TKGAALSGTDGGGVGSTAVGAEGGPGACGGSVDAGGGGTCRRGDEGGKRSERIAGLYAGGGRAAWGGDFLAGMRGERGIGRDKCGGGAGAFAKRVRCARVAR